MPSRVVVVGQSGTGKTTLGRWLGGTLGVPFTDLDDVFWRPGWREAPIDEFRADVARLAREPRWVIVGNYKKVSDLIWPRADTLVWLDLPLPLSLWRLTKRVFRQTRSGESICNGNRQHLGALVFGKDPLLWYAAKACFRYRRTWPALLRQQQHAHLDVVRLRSRGAVVEWRERVRTAVQAPGRP